MVAWLTCGSRGWLSVKQCLSHSSGLSLPPLSMVCCCPSSSSPVLPPCHTDFFFCLSGPRVTYVLFLFILSPFCPHSTANFYFLRCPLFFLLLARLFLTTLPMAISPIVPLHKLSFLSPKPFISLLLQVFFYPCLSSSTLSCCW